MHAEEWMEKELLAINEKGLDRSLTTYPRSGGKIVVDGRVLLNFSSNDYLDLAGHPEVAASSGRYLERYGCGATASRLVTGTLECHTELERALADFKGYPEALVFGSGFLTNAGVIPALVGRSDHVYADKLAHASIIDAIVLSRAELHRFRHNDVNHLETLLRASCGKGRRLIVTESVFSMDGDLAPLAQIASVATAHDAMLMVDEAHSTGIFGACGSGLIREHGLEDRVNVSMGTLSKALGSYGGFVACSAVLRRLLINRARALIYTTALPPAVVGSAIGALRAIQKDGSMGKRVLENAAIFRSRLRDGGLNTGASESQIVPIIIGDNFRALAVAERLKAKGILAVAIRPPTVPEGTARLRFSLTLAHTREDLEWAADEILRCMGEAGRQ